MIYPAGVFQNPGCSSGPICLHVCTCLPHLLVTHDGHQSADSYHIPGWTITHKFAFTKKSHNAQAVGAIDNSVCTARGTGCCWFMQAVCK